VLKIIATPKVMNDSFSLFASAKIMTTRNSKNRKLIMGGFLQPVVVNSIVQASYSKSIV
jgi:hypothetical protein